MGELDAAKVCGEINSSKPNCITDCGPGCEPDRKSMSPLDWNQVLLSDFLQRFLFQIVRDRLNQYFPCHT